VVGKLKKTVPGIGKRFVKHTRKAKKVYLELMKVMKKRTGEDKKALKETQEEMVKIAEETIAGGREMQGELELLENKSSEVNRLKGQLGEWVETVEKVVRQVKEVIKGNRNIPQRVVSLFDLGARPVKRGKSQGDTEFGRKMLLGETDHGIITMYAVLEDNPSDTTLLKPAVKGHRRLFRKRLKAVAADRGFYSQANEDWLEGSTVKQVSIPKRGRVSKERRSYQKQPWFKRLQRFRAGVEGRISVLKRKFGLKRSRVRGNSGTETWVGQGIFTHNLWMAARIG